jgi:hypothetical protein
MMMMMLGRQSFRRVGSMRLNHQHQNQHQNVIFRSFYDRSSGNNNGSSSSSSSSSSSPPPPSSSSTTTTTSSSQSVPLTSPFDSPSSAVVPPPPPPPQQSMSMASNSSVSASNTTTATSASSSTSSVVSPLASAQVSRRFDGSIPTHVPKFIVDTLQGIDPQQGELLALEYHTQMGYFIERLLSKRDLAQTLHVQPRDLRKVLSASQRRLISGVNVRDKCIILHLEHVKAIIMSDRMFLFDHTRDARVKTFSLFLPSLLYEPSVGAIASANASANGNGNGNGSPPFELARTRSCADRGDRVARRHAQGDDAAHARAACTISPLCRALPISRRW